MENADAVRQELLLRWQGFAASRNLTVPGLLSQIQDMKEPLRAERLLRTYLEEVPVALDLVAPYLGGGPRRILEVGSGMGAVSRFLAGIGHDVVACEPAPDGFDLMGSFTEAVDAACGAVEGAGALHRLSVGVDELDPEELGGFDLIFSANVLEHVPDPGRALVHLQRFLNAGGLQAHVCPNYAFPYDPHIGRPLIPFIPALTRYLLPAELRRDAAFLSVNFVTAGRLRRAARDAGFELVFEGGVLGDALRRFDSDAVFADRHAGLSVVIRIVRALRLDRVLASLPPGLASPMRFVAHRT